MNVFEFAMQMEQDGKAFYEKMAESAENAAVKNILLELAADEEKHYRIFKKFREGDMSGLKDLQETGTVALQKAKNVFQGLSAEDKSFSDDVKAAWKQAQEVEKKSEDFYRVKAGEADSDEAQKALNMIADEEAKHWTLIEHVLQYLDRPKHYIEDAEWNNMPG
jgi:rubrerythrin